MSDVTDTIVPFAPAQRRSSGNSDALDQAGQTVVGMLHQAAAVASENCQYALGVAHKLSLELRAAEDRIKTLEAKVRHYQDRAGRAEQWLIRISREIECKFLESGAGHPQQMLDQNAHHGRMHHGRMQRAAE
jgi:hypothetical protein